MADSTSQLLQTPVQRHRGRPKQTQSRGNSEPDIFRLYLYLEYGGENCRMLIRKGYRTPSGFCKDTPAGPDTLQPPA